MTWNYRIIHHDQDEFPYFAIHEVFYDDRGKITNWTAAPIDLTGESQSELVETLKQMRIDVRGKTLVESQLEKTVHAIL